MRKLIVLAFVAAGCGAPTDDQSPAVKGFVPDPPPAADVGFQVTLDPVDNLMPGESYEMCSWSDRIMDVDTFVKSAKGFQSELGHHIIVFTTKKYEQPGTTRLCTDDDMANFRFVVGIGGEGIQSSAPGDLVFKLEKGSQIVLNHHYLNASTHVARGQSAASVFYAPPGNHTSLSSAVAFVNSNLKVETGRTAQDIHCAVKDTIDFWRVSPHMHRWGTHIRVDRTATGAKSTVFDTAWQPDFTFHPPEQVTEDLGKPIRFSPGDEVDVHCEWDNNTGKPLTFGLEMCVFFGQTIDKTGQGNIACDNGEWVTF